MRLSLWNIITRKYYNYKRRYKSVLSKNTLEGFKLYRYPIKWRVR
jgi:hypothetical protein